MVHRLQLLRGWGAPRIGPLVMLAVLLAAAGPAAAATSFTEAIGTVQPKMVKIYGAGGVRGLEAYQSGFLISSEGHVLTVWSYVLDTDFITVTLDDGRKFQGELLGADPRLEIAVLKIDASNLTSFDLDQAVELDVGDRVLAFSNLYGVATGDEPASVLHGNVSVKAPLAARRGAFDSPYRGPVYVVDAMTNNPGAAGGVLTDRRGQLSGLLGKELRSSLNNTWLNYAIPIAELADSVDDILAGKTRPRSEDDSVRRPLDPHSLATLGLVLVPDVLNKTPPFIDRIVRGSAADKADLQPDDLILFVNDRIVQSCKTVHQELTFIDRIDPVRLIVQRGQELVEVVLEPGR